MLLAFGVKIDARWRLPALMLVFVSDTPNFASQYSRRLFTLSIALVEPLARHNLTFGSRRIEPKPERSIGMTTRISISYVDVQRIPLLTAYKRRQVFIALLTAHGTDPAAAPRTRTLLRPCSHRRPPQPSLHPAHCLRHCLHLSSTHSRGVHSLPECLLLRASSVALAPQDIPLLL